MVLELDQDIITYLVSMIPNERGFDWTLTQCYEGDEEHTAITSLKKKLINIQTYGLSQNRLKV